MDLTTAAPAVIDTALAALDGEFVTHLTNAMIAKERAEKVATGRFADASYAASLQAKADEAFAAARAVKAQMAPMEAEYVRRGRWTRAFIVAGGHVHSSQNCSSCNKGLRPTSFGWITEFSGKTEAEVIEAAGSRACTVCYPDAPVDAPAGRLFHKDEEAAEVARQERAEKAAVKAAKKAANAFGPYRTSRRGYGDVLETLTAAKGFLTDGEAWGWDHPSYDPSDRDAVAALLAERNGTTAADEIAAAAKRAAKRR